ncbi:dTDP-4-amino-4,6-dideoxygalactose transaminase [Dysgonomonas sp. 521]|uniref:dTDP-4-amino-4,6-dideoxygalactose transaminase n=1 Tax=Dysgonomonas sp. 521 TaxID=2302932 RepID=UPI0013D46702|nr:dTDP-4-amino-4,6-dideoxygalactose transaminase [Dysgonomonas sp. 521]NDV96390.1 dTDP-4-amino-4,6-dideoxygalactose transaminase [Dysgonomonas sp. 521]
MIPFNKPYQTGNETSYISQVMASGKLAGNGNFTKKCQSFFEQRYRFGKCLLTTSCTDALEMAAILIDVQPGDEIIMPSYTFVSTANAFVLRGARIVFADSMQGNPNMDADRIEELITPATKAIVPVHYAGFACDMDKIMQVAEKYGIFVIEDAAQAIDNYYVAKDGNRKPLGSIGHLAAFSFHETKNIISGEGGMLVVNDKLLEKRAEIIWEKGTNRSAFFRGEVDKYGWVDMGSSFLPSEIIAAFLWAQVENMDDIQSRRMKIWTAYYEGLCDFAAANNIGLPATPEYSTNNAHTFYLLCESLEQRTRIINHLKTKDISSVFHYISLHSSPYYLDKHDGRALPQADRYTNTLVRLPLFYELTDENIKYIISEICHSL